MTNDLLHGFYLTLQNTLQRTQANLLEGMQTLAEAEASLPDAVDRAAMEAERNFALLIRERDRKTREEILQALARIESGEYGICQECGEDIALARLRARPTAVLCTDCQARLEDAGSRPRITREFSSWFRVEHSAQDHSVTPGRAYFLDQESLDGH